MCNSQFCNELLACNLSGQKTAQPVPRSRSQEFCRRKPQNMLFSPTISPNFFPPLSLFGVSSPHTQLHDPKTSVSKCGKPARKKPDMNVRSFTANGRWGVGGRLGVIKTNVNIFLHIDSIFGLEKNNMLIQNKRGFRAEGCLQLLQK